MFHKYTCRFCMYKACVRACVCTYVNMCVHASVYENVFARAYRLFCVPLPQLRLSNHTGTVNTDYCPLTGQSVLCHRYIHIGARARAHTHTHTHTLTRMHAHTHTFNYKLRHQQKVIFSLIYWSQNRLTPNACDLKWARSESSAVKIWGEHRRASHHYGLPHEHGNKSKQNSNTETYSFISKIYLQYACIITVVSSLPIHAVCI